MPALSRTITDAIGVSDRVSFSIRDAIGVADDVTYTTSTPLPLAVEADTALGGTNVSVGELPTAVETDSSGTGVGVIEVPNSDGFGAGPFGASPFGATTFTEITAFTGVVGVGDIGTAAEHDLAIPLTSLVDDGEFAEAIADAARTPIYVVKADWNRNGLYDHPLSDLTPLVTSVSVDRALTGTLPVEIGLVEGYASAELSIVLEGSWSNSVLSTTTRTNLAVNPSVELNVAGYSLVVTGTLNPALGVFASNAITPVAGQFYLYSRPLADGTSGYMYHRCPRVPVTPGAVYTFSAYRYVVGALEFTAVGVDWLDAAGVQLGLTSPTGANIVDAGWARGYVTATVPAGVTYARQFLVSGTVDVNNYARWDAVMAEVGSALNAYFDGDSPGAHWNGVPQASSSTMVTSQVDVNDITLDPVDVFAPYRADSPLYGQPILQTPIYLETGFIANDGPRLQRRFTGTLTQVHPQSLARSVALHAVDPVARLRNTVTTAGTGMYDTILQAVGPDAYRSRINSQWLIDRALRANGIYASPAPWPAAILSVTGHGSMIPEVGWGGAPEEYYATYRGDMWQPSQFPGMLATIGGPRGRWWTTDQLTAASGTGFGFFTWLAMFPGDGHEYQLLVIDLTEDQSWFIDFGIRTDGRPYLDAYSSAGSHRAVPTTYTPPASGRWQSVGVHARFAATTMTATFRINQQTYVATVTTGARTPTAWRPNPQLVYAWDRSFTNFSLWVAGTAPTVWFGEDPQGPRMADIDRGVNELTGVPAMLETDAWGLIKEVADAEGATFQFDENGRPQFRTSAGTPRQHLVTEVISADRNLADLVSTTDESTIRNVINIKTKTQVIADWADYFTSDTVDQFDTPPGTSIFDIPIDADVYDVPETRDAFGANASLTNMDRASFIFYTNEQAWNDGQKLDATKDHIRLALVFADNPIEIIPPDATHVPAVYIRVERPDVQTMRIFITNYSTRTVRFATPSQVDGNGVLRDGQPGLLIPARKVVAGPEQVETFTDNASVASYGASSFDVGGSQEKWRQLPVGFRGLAAEVLSTTANPVPVLDAVDVPHDPRRGLGDRVVLTDPQGLGEVTASIVGLTNTYDPGGAKDKITVRPIAPPGLGVLDDPTHGLLDSTLVLGP